MDKIYLEGLEVPDLLVQMIDSGLWLALNNKKVAERLGFDATDDVEFFDLSKIKDNTVQLRKLAEGDYAEQMSLVSGRTKDLQEGYLNVEKALVIAATYGDEMLCLDYSDSRSSEVPSQARNSCQQAVDCVSLVQEPLHCRTEPKVVATNYSNCEMKWVIVAENIDILVEILMS